MDDYFEIRPAEIERKSFEIIREKLADRHFPEEEEPIIMRVIHTTADFSFADTLTFSDGAVERGLSALRGGAPVFTDTNMARAGISRAALKKLGSEAVCFMADPEIAEKAKVRGVTRAIASIERAAEIEQESGKRFIFAIGNAPTALIRLCELADEGLLHPILVIGVPVGFVNVVHAKEMLLARPSIPSIVARGNKGGSTVAAAIVNAILYEITRGEERKYDGKTALL